MEANEYHKLAMRTANPLLGPERLYNAVSGLIGEGGELAEKALTLLDGDGLQLQLFRVAAHFGAAVDMVKKARHQGHPLDAEAVRERLTEARDALDAALDALLFGPALEEAPAPAWSGEDVAAIAQRPGIINELGDALWYVTQGADAVGLSLAAVMQSNVDKLQRRYGGSFSAEASINREERE